MRYLLSKPQSIQELGQRANQEDTIFPEPDKSTLPTVCLSYATEWAVTSRAKWLVALSVRF